jgi:hypothetical protein
MTQKRRAELANSIVAKANLSEVKFREGLPFVDDEIGSSFPEDLVVARLEAYFGSRQKKFAVIIPITKFTYKEEAIRTLVAERCKLMLRSSLYNYLLNNPVLTKPKSRLPL